MIIKTRSGPIVTNKRSLYAKACEAYIETGAFSGRETLAAAMRTARELRDVFPSLCARDSGKLAGFLFKHRPDDALLVDMTGKSYPRGG